MIDWLAPLRSATLYRKKGIMTFKNYQSETRKTAMYEESIDQLVGEGDKETFKLLCLSYLGLGLGEVGEIQGKIKKILRDSKGIITEEHKKAIGKEIGDLLWYVSETCSCLGLDMGEVAEGNLEKLRGRKERGVLGGDGDER